MKLGEKLQRLRKQNGLSQEQLAARLGISRQAVSKWELDETMPDTENVIQLSRLFKVSCDYLLRDEVEESDAPRPAASGETHLTERDWTRSAIVLSLAVCIIGLVLALGGRIWTYEQTIGPLVIGLVIQVVGLALFELAVPRMGKRKRIARLIFYLAACWLVSPTLFMLAFWNTYSFNIGIYYSSFLSAVVTIITLFTCYLFSEKK